MSTSSPWVPPPTWPIPREWDGERCFILCSGESIGPQTEMIRQLKGRFIAVKHGLLTRPDAEVLFISGERSPQIAHELMPQFRGKYAIVRGRHHPELPASLLRVTRSKAHGTLTDLRDHVTGLDSGTSAINVAYHFGATEIVMLGYDMRGGHFCAHPLQNPPKSHFIRHMEHLPSLNEDAKRKGIRIVNCSPGSAVTAFERQPLEAFL